MRRFTHPDPLRVVIDAQTARLLGVRIPESTTDRIEREATFLDFVEDTVGADPKGAVSTKALRAVIRFIAAARMTAPGSTIDVESEDWEMARGILETPSAPYVSQIARQMMPFFDAVIDAVDTKKDP